MNEEGSPKITLKDEWRSDCEAKLQEYKERLPRQMQANPYQPPEVLPAWWAQRILSELLKTGEVETHALARAIQAELGGYFELRWFEHYCRVIDNYSRNGVTR